MAKLKDCQFIEIKIDGKVISGSSEEKKYAKWMEGYASGGINTVSGQDGAYFDHVNMSLLMTKDTSSFYEYYLKRGYKEIIITIVHRGSDQFDQDYEVQRTVYSKCKINSLSIQRRDNLFMDIIFTLEGMIEVTFNVPNATGSALDKIGPIKYDIPEKALK